MRSNTGSEEVERFEWVGECPIQEAGCLTVVRGTDIERVADAFGAVTERARRLDFEEFCEESFAQHDNYSLIGVRQVGDWLLVVEDNWFEGARPEVLRRVSVDAEVVSTFWNVNALTRFSHAADGEVRTSFEALMPGYREGTRPDALEELRAGLPWTEADLGRRGVNTVSLMLALTARITGQVIGPEWLRGDFVTYPVAAWPDDLPEVPEVVRERLGDGHSPTLVANLRECDERARRCAAAAVARRVLERAECDDHAALSALLAALMAGEAVDLAVIGEAVRAWKWQLTADRMTAKARKQIGAAEVLRQAANPDTFVAVFAALSAARNVAGADMDELTAIAADALAAA